MKVGFVVTNYNNSNFSLSFIDSIIHSEILLDYFIVIVDNCSNQSEYLLLLNQQKKTSNLKIIKSEINLGYFGGLNVGLDYIREFQQDINYVLIGNNDILIDKHFFRQLIDNVSVFENYPVVSPFIVTLEGHFQNPHVVDKISKFREFIYDLYYTNYNLSKVILFISKISKSFSDRKDEMNYQNESEIYQGHGSCYILGPLFINHFTKLFAPTFLMGEEFFLAYQLKQKKFNIYYTPKIKITHLGHASLNNVPRKEIWKISKQSHKIYRKYLKIYNNL